MHAGLLGHFPAELRKSHSVRYRQATQRGEIEEPLIQPSRKGICIFAGQNIWLESGDVEVLCEICGNASVEGYHCAVLQRERINRWFALPAPTHVAQRRTIVDVPTVHPDELLFFAVEMLGRRRVGEGHLLAEGESCQRGRANIREWVGNILPIIRNICTAVRVFS